VRINWFRAAKARHDEYSGMSGRRPAMSRFVFLLVLLPFLAFAAESRDSKVLNDRADVLSTGRWIYNDFPKGLAEAKATGKPLLVVLRCVP
jgi:serine protease Do